VGVEKLGTEQIISIVKFKIVKFQIKYTVSIFNVAQSTLGRSNENCCWQ